MLLQLPGWQKNEESTGEPERSIESSLSASGHRVMSSQADVDGGDEEPDASQASRRSLSSQESRQVSSQVAALRLSQGSCGSSQAQSPATRLSSQHASATSSQSGQGLRSQAASSPRIPSGLPSHQPPKSSPPSAHKGSSQPKQSQGAGQEKRPLQKVGQEAQQRPLPGVYPTPSSSMQLQDSDRTPSQSQRPFLVRFSLLLFLLFWFACSDRCSS